MERTITQTQWIQAGESPEERSSAVRAAARVLLAGGLVAIPTETVYGLAASALDGGAVKKIFEAKGRPQDNPLIVHLADPSWLGRYAEDIPPAAFALAEAFWPGPLTIVLKKSSLIPDVVSAGLPTAGFRLPAHPLAREVIAAAGVPLAAPSANLSGSPSPTTAAHVAQDLDGRIDMILDGGPCAVGVESTVLSLAGGRAKVLRPGGITPEQIAGVLGSVEVDPAVTHPLAEGAKPSSPGMKYRHYAPRAKITLVDGGLEPFAAYVKRHAAPGCAVLCFAGEESRFQLPAVPYGRAEDSAEQARALFDALRKLDETGAARVFARCPPKTGVGLAVYNRLLRAAGFDEIVL